MSQAESLNRALIVDKQFVDKVARVELPKATSEMTLASAGISHELAWSIFKAQCLSRHLDLQARQLKEQHQSYYTIGSSGHEGNAAIAAAFRETDLAFLHYRSGAFMFMRMNQETEESRIHANLQAIMASRLEPVCQGRHKVFGSVKYAVPPQTSTIASHLPKALGTAFSIELQSVLNANRQLPKDSVVLCSFGDASFNHSTAQGTLNTCQWLMHQHMPLPVVWICEDNALGISVPTPPKWVQEAMNGRSNIHYLSCDGLNFADVYSVAVRADTIARRHKQPCFIHFKTVRLLGHAGSDIEQQYRTDDDILYAEANDPLLHSVRLLLEENVASIEQICEYYEITRKKYQDLTSVVLKELKLDSKDEVMRAIIPPKKVSSKIGVDNTRREAVFGAQYAQLQQPKTMAQQINCALTDILLSYPNTLVFGEDVGKKGGVYRVTAELQKRFGQQRVFDTLLDEQTILGTAIGVAHNGLLPIPEVQFMAYIHNAIDQLRGEAATLPFFSNGQFTNPMVIRLPGLAYQKGFGGHFHNENAIAFLREIPGLIIACPSRPHEAALLLRSCIEQADIYQRVVVFIEPIALYMTKDLYEKNDKAWLSLYPEPGESIPIGDIGVTNPNGEWCIISYGNGHYLSLQAAKLLEVAYDISVKVIDLRWLAPMNISAIIAEIQDLKGVLIVDETRRTGSVSESLISELVQEGHPLPRVQSLTAEDSFIPLGPSWETLLPNVESIVQRIFKMANE